MYAPYFKPQYKVSRYRALFTRYYLLRTDKHRLIKFRRSIGKIITVQYPHLYPLTRTARDFEV